MYTDTFYIQRAEFEDFKKRVRYSLRNVSTSEEIDATNSIPFNSTAAIIEPLTVTGPVTFTVDTSDATPGSGASRRVIADGVNIPSISGMKEMAGSSGYLNTAGVVNLYLFYFDGVDYWVSITQDKEDASGTSTTTTTTGTTTTTSTTTTTTSGAATTLEDKTWDDLTGWTNLHSGGNAAAEIAVIDGVNKLHQSNTEGGGYNVTGKVITGWTAGDTLRIYTYGVKVILGTGGLIEITNHTGVGGLLGGGLDYISSALPAGDSFFDVDTTGFTCNILDIKTGAATSDLGMRRIKIDKL